MFTPLFRPLRLAIHGAAALLLVACEHADITRPTLRVVSPNPYQALTIKGALWTKTVTLPKSGQTAETMTIGALAERNVTEMTLHVTNGNADGSNRAANIDVMVNGTRAVFGAKSFAGTTVLVPIGTQRPVTVTVELRGLVGGKVTLAVEAGAPVTADGGTLSLSGGTVAVTVPAGALESPIAISAEPLPAPPADQPPPPSGVAFSEYEFGPDGTQFATPITITLPVPAASFPKGATPALYWRKTDADEWEPLGDATVNADGTVSGTIDHFTRIGVLAREVLVCPNTVDAVPTIDSALVVVARRGTIRLCAEQTHTIGRIRITKPVTISGDAAAVPQIVTAGQAVGFYVVNVPNGTVRFRQLKFTGEAGQVITSDSTYDQVVVDTVEIVNRVGATSGVYSFASSVAGAKVTVRGSTISFGNTAIVAINGANVDLFGNTFNSQLVSGNVRYIYTGGARQPSGNVIGNTFDQCGRFGCISIAGADQIVVADNVMRTLPRYSELPPVVLQPGQTSVVAGYGPLNSPGVRFGIYVTARNAVVRNNVIEGQGTITNFDCFSCGQSFTYAGIAIQGPTVAPFYAVDAVISGNRVTGATDGIMVYRQANTVPDPTRDVRVTATDNVVSGGSVGLNLVGGPSVLFTRNDLLAAPNLFSVRQGSGAVGSLRPPVGSGALACNWWGAPTGPAKNANVDPAAFTPVATAPIAGTTNACP